MNRLRLTFVAGALTCAAVVSAQSETQPTAPPDTSTATQQDTQSSQATEPTSGTVNPLPSTSPTEGTAADRTQPGATASPGQTATQEPSQTPVDQSTTGTTSTTPDTTSSTTDTTSSTTGTTSDLSASDETRLAAADGMQGKSASKMMGATVQGSSGESVGTVQDFLIDESGKISAVVISPSGTSSAASQTSTIPWDAVRSVASDGKITVDSSQLQSMGGRQ